jgi:hypothetical protein
MKPTEGDRSNPLEALLDAERTFEVRRSAALGAAEHLLREARAQASREEADVDTAIARDLVGLEAQRALAVQSELADIARRSAQDVARYDAISPILVNETARIVVQRIAEA